MEQPLPDRGKTKILSGGREGRAQGVFLDLLESDSYTAPSLHPRIIAVEASLAQSVQSAKLQLASRTDSFYRMCLLDKQSEAN